MGAKKLKRSVKKRIYLSLLGVVNLSEQIYLKIKHLSDLSKYHCIKIFEESEDLANVYNQKDSNTERIASIFNKHSSYSDSGSDIIVTALPTGTESVLDDLSYKMERIMTLKSKSPSGEIYPTEPEKRPLLKRSYFSIKDIARFFGAPVIDPMGKLELSISDS